MGDHNSMSIPLSKIPQLNENNYLIWSMKVSAVLRGKQLFKEVIEADEPPLMNPEATEDGQRRYTAWERKNDEAFSLIIVTLSDDIAGQFIGETRAKRVWEKLKEIYVGSVNDRRIDKTLELKNINMLDRESIDSYFSRARSIASQCASLGQTIPTREIVFYIVRGLHPKYEKVAVVLRANRSIGIEEMQQILKEEEARLNQGQRAEQAYRAGGRAQRPFRRSDKFCGICRKCGHTPSECWYRNGQEGRKSQKAKVTNTDAKSSGSVSASTGKKKQQEHALNVSDVQDDEHNTREEVWSLDSGSTSHMTHKLDWLEDAKPWNVRIKLAENGREINSEAIGDIKATTKLSDGTARDVCIKDVLFVPNLRNNLLSVPSLVKRGNTVMFDETGAKIIGTDGDIIVESEEENSVYVVRTRCRGKSSEECMATKETEDKATQTDKPNDIDPASSSGNEQTGSSVADKSLWHRRMGHLNYEYLDKMKRKEMVRGLEYLAKDNEACEDCIVGKMIQAPFRSVEASGINAPLERIHLDICGPISTSSLSRAKYILVIVDSYSRYTTVYTIKARDQVLDCLKKFVNVWETQLGLRLKAVRTDNAGEFSSSEFETYLVDKGIKHEKIVPYCPQSNGLAEAMIRVLTSKARTMLLAAKLPVRFWDEAIATATYLYNRSPTKSTGDMTPYEKWMSKKPCVSFIKVFGCVAYSHVPKSNRDKFDPRGSIGIFVGYSEERQAYRVYDIDQRTIIETRTVKFNEYRDGGSVLKRSSREKEERGSEDEDEDVFYLHCPDLRHEDDLTRGERGQERRSTEDDGTSNAAVDNTQHGGITSSQEGRRVREDASPVDTARESDEEEANLTKTLWPFEIPTDYQKAVTSAQREEWLQAMEREMNSMKEHDVWDLVPRRGAHKIIKSKWVYALKKGEEEDKPKFKARLVAVGTQQQRGVDFEESSSPVVKKETFRLLISLAAQLNLVIRQYDVKTAYLYGDVDGEVFMEQPKGFEEGDDFVCKLKRSLYGLPQSGYCWNVKLNSKLEEIGLRRCQSDPCLYTKSEQGRIFALCVYVDDVLVVSSDEETLNSVMDRIKGVFELVEIKPPLTFLGIEITQREGSIGLSQKSYILKSLAKYGLSECNSLGVPGSQDLKLDEFESSPSTDKGRFQEMLGTLMYLSVSTRPDISYCVHRLAQFNQDPREVHAIALKRIYRYLKGTTQHELVYRQVSEPVIELNSDASWSNTKDGRSYSGYTCKLGDNLLAWRSTKQTIVAMSTCEAELTAMSEAVKEFKWLNNLLVELDLGGMRVLRVLPAVINTDSQSAIDWVKRRSSGARTRHFNRELYFIRDEVDRGNVILTFVDTKNMEADILTKVVTRDILEMGKAKMGLIDATPMQGGESVGNE